MRIKIAPDKWKHFWVGIPLGIVLQLICFHYFTQTALAAGAALVLVVIICYGFELFSMITKLGHHDLIDAVAGIVGGGVGIVAVVILQMLTFL